MGLNKNKEKNHDTSLNKKGHELWQKKKKKNLSLIA